MAKTREAIAGSGLRIAYYVSGHGYGHAVRAGEVVRVLARAGAEVEIRSDAAPIAFDELPGGVRLTAVSVDVGVSQHDALRVDEAGTLARFAAFWREVEPRSEFEASYLRAGEFDVVVCDVAPLGIVAALRAGIPSVLVANFTWDVIYEAWSDQLPQAATLAAVCRDAYAQATLSLVTTPDCGVAKTRRREDIGLIVRRAKIPRDEVRRQLGIGRSEIAVLVAFGGFGPPPLVAPRRADGIRYLSFSPLGWPDSMYQQVDRQTYSHPDLVAASDVLLGKPGYGTVAECAAHNTRMLWLERDRFAETAGLVRAMIDHVGGCALSPLAIQDGRLSEAVRAALATPPRKGPLATDGAEVAAARILAITDGELGSGTSV